MIDLVPQLTAYRAMIDDGPSPAILSLAVDDEKREVIVFATPDVPAQMMLRVYTASRRKRGEPAPIAAAFAAEVWVRAAPEPRDTGDDALVVLGVALDEPDAAIVQRFTRTRAGIVWDEPECIDSRDGWRVDGGLFACLHALITYEPT